jgi:hypothetical protein
VRSGCYYLSVAIDVTVGVVLAAAVSVITLLGALLAAKTRAQRTAFWVCGTLAFVLTIIQIVRQAQSQDASLKNITGGDSFCFVRLQFDNAGVYVVVLSSGKYPLYDLSMRLWHPEEWRTAVPPTPELVWSKVAAETTSLGTLPNDDFRNALKFPLPSTGSMYDIEFSARNGSWLQTLWVRPSLQGWKMASIVRHTQKVGGVEAQKPGRKICFYIDQGFPFQPSDEASTWAQDTPPCVPGSHS